MAEGRLEPGGAARAVAGGKRVLGMPMNTGVEPGGGVAETFAGIVAPGALRPLALQPELARLSGPAKFA